ncbi:HAD-IC family P-type ATPase [Rhabdobacter roseus]|uniref:Magnesium-transporting ATPase (P-type) n=1 Tax=Rhabdobacter roseus TaxID=1655419 RepID=A0A840TVC2_9BACT|nr:magnesium-transporting ATPase (P-type) [Rhabdobacter roseus]
MKNTLKQDWHAAEVDEVLKLTDAQRGLTDDEVRQRQEELGKNVLPTGKQVSLAAILWHQFKSPLIYVLVVAGVISLLVGEHLDAGFIGIILLINAGLGTWQEWRAESGAQSLQEMIKLKTSVMRNGTWQELDAEALVPGDVIRLESGVQVPADARLVEVNNLQVEEAMLTGESLPAHKETAAGDAQTTNAGDKKNLVYAGTTVLVGRGRAVVTATGLHTEIGKIADSLNQEDTSQTPLIERMERFSRMISVIILVAAVILGGIGWWHGMELMDLFFLAIAMVVSAIPEGLPIAMTVALSIASRRMAKRNVIVRKLSAVEGLGSCTYILSDKTGTLTVDQQTVRQIYLPDGQTLAVTGEGYNGEGEIQIDNPDSEHLHRFLRIATLANESTLEKKGEEWRYKGDAVDVALLALPYKLGSSPDEIGRETDVQREIPYESENKYSAVYYHRNGRLVFGAKGAWEVFEDKLVEDEKEQAAEMAEKMAADGLRVLAMVYSITDDDTSDLAEELHLAGLVGLIDPIRPEVKDAIAECHEAGIKIAMVTGDHPLTALAIAKEINIADGPDNLISGAELRDIEDDEATLVEVLRDKTVFARVSPAQKQKLVKAFQQRGEYVAITGDGVNDAPALRQSNVGVAMGSGTDVTRGAASIVLKDDNFASIVAGVEEGRYSYDNIRKVVFLLLSTAAAEVFLIMLSTLFGLPKPLTAVQILWLNVVTNGLQDIALVFERGEPGAMKHPPRSPEEGIFDRQMISQTVLAAFVMTALGFSLWVSWMNQGREEVSARNDLLLVMVLLQNFHAFNVRSETRSVFRIPISHNYLLLLSVFLAQGIHIAAMHIPLTQRLLEIEPESLDEWFTYFGLAALILVVSEIYKVFVRRREGREQKVG